MITRQECHHFLSKTRLEIGHTPNPDLGKECPTYIKRYPTKEYKDQTKSK